MIEMDTWDTDNGVWQPWWRNFYNYYEKQGINMNFTDEISRVLQEWNAFEEDVDSTKFHFENEQDQLVFLLRWA
jgi:hypothetical protein